MPRSTSFHERLQAAAEAHTSWLCVGLDPDPARVPPDLVTQDASAWVPRFLLEVVEATRDLVCCYKPNIAFFEALGVAGQAALRALLRGLPHDVPFILDAKRGDTPDTMRAYARALFDELDADAVTVSPYLGGETLASLFTYADRGVFVLCKTSNPGAGEIQDLIVRGNGHPQARAGGGEPLFVYVARRALAWDQHRTLGLVVGATYPQDVAAVRGAAPQVPILLPGVGAQGGSLEQSVQAGLDERGGGVIVNASRTVLYASRESDWRQAARAEAERLRAAINAARSAASGADTHVRVQP